MRVWKNMRLGLCLPVLALVGLAGCESGHHGNDSNNGGYYGANDYPYGGYNRRWWGSSDDHHHDGDDQKQSAGYNNDSWKDRKYQRKEDNGRPGDAEQFNNRLCHNGVRGDAPASCPD
jgi:hypothetical protein